MNIRDHAFQLTAYEKGGFIDLKDYKKDIIKSELQDVEFDELLAAYNEYCFNSSCEEYFLNDEEFFELFFENKMDLVRAIKYGDYNFNDDFVQFNGYGNIDSFSQYQVKEQILDNDDFINFLLDWSDDYDFIEMNDLTEHEQEIMKKAYALIAQGY